MSNRTRILYIAHEITPFLETSPIASVARHLTQAVVMNNHEVRALVPRFGVINERKNAIHEVQRLSGVNIPVEEEYISLIIKVSSIREARLQVYFVDNEDLFERKGVFFDPEGNFYEDNYLRAIFFCKAVLTMIHKLEWAPDIVHCHGWMSAFVPMYLRTTYKNHPLFKRSKVVYTLYDTPFAYTSQAPVFPKVKLRSLRETHFSPYWTGGFQGFNALAAHYADRVTQGFDQTRTYDPAWLQEVNSQYIMEGDSLVEAYFNLYRDILPRQQRKHFLLL